MAILNIGSLNWDHAFKVSHLPAKGETVAAKSANLSLGGKGQNGGCCQTNLTVLWLIPIFGK